MKATRSKVLAFRIDSALHTRLKKLAAASTLKKLLEPELLRIAERLERDEARREKQHA